MKIQPCNPIEYRIASHYEAGLAVSQRVGWPTEIAPIFECKPSAGQFNQFPDVAMQCHDSTLQIERSSSNFFIFGEQGPHLTVACHIWSLLDGCVILTVDSGDSSTFAPPTHPPQSALILEEKISYFLWIIVGLATQAGRTSNKRNAQRWEINRAGIREGLKVKQNCLTLCNFHRPFTSTPCHQTTRLTVRGRGGSPVDICGNCGPIFPCIKW